MKVREIEVGERYAVKERMSGVRGAFPTTAPIRHVTVVDKVGSQVICTYPALIADPPTDPDRIVSEMSQRNYRPGNKTLRIPATDVVCLSVDYHGKPQPDGRIDAPDVTHAAGHTFEQNRVPVS